MEEVLIESLKSQGFTVIAFLLAIIALWRTLIGAHAGRITALEDAVEKCMEKHEGCEKRNRELSAAMIDVLEHRDQNARDKLKRIMAGEES